MLYKLNVTVLISGLIAAWELCVLRKGHSLSFLSLFIFIFNSHSDLFYLIIVGVEGYIFAWSHRNTHTHKTLVWTRDSPIRSDLYLTTHNTHNRQTSMPPGGIRTPIPASERPQTNALARAATGLRRNTTHKSGHKRLTQSIRTIPNSKHQIIIFKTFIIILIKRVCILYILLFPVALRSNAGHGLLILRVSRSHTTTHHSR